MKILTTPFPARTEAAKPAPVLSLERPTQDGRGTARKPKPSRRRVEAERFVMLLDAVEGLCGELRQLVEADELPRSRWIVEAVGPRLAKALTGDGGADAAAFLRSAVLRHAADLAAALPVGGKLDELRTALTDPTPSEICAERRAIRETWTPEERRTRRAMLPAAARSGGAVAAGG